MVISINCGNQLRILVKKKSAVIYEFVLYELYLVDDDCMDMMV